MVRTLNSSPAKVINHLYATKGDYRGFLLQLPADITDRFQQIEKQCVS